MAGESPAPPSSLTIPSVSDISITDTMKSKKVELPDDVMRLIPLTPAVFFILFALADGDKHGYAIMQETTKLSEGVPVLIAIGQSEKDEKDRWGERNQPHYEIGRAHV